MNLTGWAMAIELNEIKQRLNNQDNRATHHPIYVVFQKKGNGDEFVTVCFTYQGCKDYLAVNGHNLNQPFIYVHSLFRNSEMLSIREFLKGDDKDD